MRVIPNIIILLLLSPQASGQVVRDTTRSPIHVEADKVALELNSEFASQESTANLKELAEIKQRGLIEASIAEARLAYESAMAQQGEGSLVAANMGLEYGVWLSRVGLAEEARAVLSKNIAVIQADDSDHGFKLANAYLSLANVSKDQEQLDNANRALELFESNRDAKELELAIFREAAARLLVKYHDNRERAESLLLLLIPVYEKQYGINSKEVISVLIVLGESFKRRGLFNSAWRQTRAFGKAMKYSRQHEDPLVYADTLLEIGSSLLRTSPHRGRKFTKRALAIYEKELGAKHIKTAATLLNLGIYYSGGSRNDSANNYLLRSLDVFRTDKDYRNLKIKALTHVVKNFELTNQSAEATPYCREIGRISPWISDQTPKLLYRKRIDYWPRYDSGSVDIEFSIDANGFVQNARITQSSVSIRTSEEVLKAVQGYRYSPKFENGVAVTSHNHGESFTFEPYR